MNRILTHIHTALKLDQSKTSSIYYYEHIFNTIFIEIQKGRDHLSILIPKNNM